MFDVELRNVFFVIEFSVLDHDSLNFIERNLITGAVIELGRFRVFVVGNLLGVLPRAVTLPPNVAVFKLCKS